MNYCNSIRFALVCCACLLPMGCGAHWANARFDAQLAQAEKHVEQSSFTIEEMQEINHQIRASWHDPNVSNEELHRRVRAAIQAVVNSGSTIWLNEFFHLGFDGELGMYSYMVVWEFALKHPDMFFSDSDADNDYRFVKYHFESIAENSEEVDNAMKTLEAYVTRSEGEPKRRAQEWIEGLKDFQLTGGDTPMPEPQVEQP